MPEELAAEVVASNQRTCSESRSQPPAEVGEPPAQRVEERPVECDIRIPRSQRAIAVEDAQTGDESSFSVSPWSPQGIAVSDSEKAEAPANSLETQFQQVRDPSVPTAIEMVDVALRSYFLTPASEPKLTIPDEVHEAIGVLRNSKAPGLTVSRTGP